MAPTKPDDPIPPVKRGRGRPRKPESERRTPLKPPSVPGRGRGRPPKNGISKAAAATAGAASTTPSAPKPTSTGRPRGRPRKNPLTDGSAAAPPPAQRAAGDATTAPAPSADAPKPRGRGRPRKADTQMAHRPAAPPAPARTAANTTARCTSARNPNEDDMVMGAALGMAKDTTRLLDQTTSADLIGLGDEDAHGEFDGAGAFY